MKKIKAILFDMDGVLIDAKEWHYEALNEALKLFGMEISMYEHLHTFDGLPTKAKLEMLGEHNYLPKQLYDFINQVKQKNTIKKVNEKCHPMFHHEYALSRLKAEGYLIAVCSNSIRNSIESMMDKSGLTDYLNIIVSNEDVIKAKPDPEMYVKAMEMLGVNPEECIVVEDNPNGVMAGIASGATVLQVETVYDVNYTNIRAKIDEVENG